MRRSILLLGFTALLWSRAASAQISTSPAQLAPPFEIGRNVSDLDGLTNLYNAGNWPALRHEVQLLLDATSHAATGLPNGGSVIEAVNSSRHYVVVTWIGSDGFGKTMLSRVVMHNPGPVEPFSPDLPGVGVHDGDAVYEVFFSRGTRGRIVDVYASSRDKDQVAETLPAFIQAVAAPLFSAVGFLGGTMSGAVPAAPPPPVAPGVAPPPPPPPPPPVIPIVAATVSRVGLPFARATIKWKAAAKELVDADAFLHDLDGLHADLLFLDSPHAPCTLDYAADAVAIVAASVHNQHCLGPTATSAACRTEVDTALRARFNATTCAGHSPSPVERRELDAVDKKIRKFVVDNLTTTAEAEITFKNRPLTHWSFGAGSGVITTASLSLPRVDIDTKENKIVADPLPRVMTLSFVNWSPLGFDGELDHVGWAERVRPFFGATLTPDFGLAAGGNFLLARGIGLIGGTAVMFSKGAKSDEIGKEPADSDKPYEISYARVKFFIGISFNFK